MNQLTASDALDLIEERAQWCRANGESDMRNIVYTIADIRSMVAQGKDRDEILQAFVIDENN